MGNDFVDAVKIRQVPDPVRWVLTILTLPPREDRKIHYEPPNKCRVRKGKVRDCNQTEVIFLRRFYTIRGKG